MLGAAADEGERKLARFSACIEMLFQETPAFEERIGLAAAAGLPAVEFWGWQKKDVGAIEAALRKHRVALSAFCVDPMGRIVDPSTHGAFLEGVRASCETAQRLGCNRLIVTTGNELPGVPRSEQQAAVVAALRKAAPIAEKAGVTLVLEPLNTLVDHKGYYLWSSHEGYEIIDAVAHPNVRLLFDIYHQQIMEGNLIANVTAHLEQIGHFHAADVPGRHELGGGEIQYANVLRAIDASGYRGYVGLEYRPTGSTQASLETVRKSVGVGA